MATAVNDREKGKCIVPLHSMQAKENNHNESRTHARTSDNQICSSGSRLVRARSNTSASSLKKLYIKCHDGRTKMLFEEASEIPLIRNQGSQIPKSCGVASFEQAWQASDRMPDNEPVKAANRYITIIWEGSSPWREARITPQCI